MVWLCAFAEHSNVFHDETKNTQCLVKEIWKKPRTLVDVMGKDMVSLKLNGGKRLPSPSL